MSLTKAAMCPTKTAMSPTKTAMSPKKTAMSLKKTTRSLKKTTMGLFKALVRTYKPAIRNRIVTSLILPILITLSAPSWSENTRVQLKTDLGKITLELYDDKAPITVKNFLHYVNTRFYNGTIFHRVIPGFVVQGGGFTFDFIKKSTRDPIKNESNNGLKNTYGTLAMARRNDPDSATSQFYINLGDNHNLNATPNKPGYTVFGRVVEGMQIVEKITAEPRGLYRDYPDAPNVPVRVLSASQL